MARKIHHDIHVPYKKLGELSPAELLAVEGPKFVTKDHKTLAVLISHDKWKKLNHGLPNVNPHKVMKFLVGEQNYLVIPVERYGSTLFQAKPETGLMIFTGIPKKKAKS
jgi:hypothetical protein